MEKEDDKEGKATADKIKVKEESLEVAGAKCWRGKWMSVLCFIGEIFKSFPKKAIFATIKAEESAQNVSSTKKEIFPQRLGSCLAPSFLLWCPTHSWPLSSTTLMANCNYDGTFLIVLTDVWGTRKYVNTHT